MKFKHHFVHIVESQWMSKDVGDEEMVQENLKSKYNAAFNIAIRYGFCSDCRWAFESKECMACDCYVNAVSLIKQAIVKQIDTDAEPFTVETQPVTQGKWKRWRFHRQVSYQKQCSVCGMWSYDMGKFCPNCGVKIMEDK